MKLLSKLIPLTFATALLLFAGNLKAQIVTAKTFGLSLGIEPGLPTTQQSNYTAFVLGGTIRFQYGIFDRLTATATTGGYHFFPATIPGTTTRYTSFGVGPVKAGLKGFVLPNEYISFEAGEGVEVTEQGFAGGQKKLLLSPGFGYADKHWDVGFHYESLSGDQNIYGIFALRIAYGFKL
jgi:hypothetical protein